MIPLVEAISSAVAAFGTVFTFMVSNPYFAMIMGISVVAVIVAILAGIFK